MRRRRVGFLTACQVVSIHESFAGEPVSSLYVVATLLCLCMLTTQISHRSGCLDLVEVYERSAKRARVEVPSTAPFRFPTPPPELQVETSKAPKQAKETSPVSQMFNMLLILKHSRTGSL